MSKKTWPAKFNVIAIGNRDYYEVALALEEAGRLGKLVTDFYCPDFLRPVLKKRFRKEICARKTLSFFPVAILATLFKHGKLPLLITKLLDDAFGFFSAFYTYFSTNRAIVYSYYLEGFVAFYKMFGLRPMELVCFQVHPTPWMIMDIIKQDKEKFATVANVEFKNDVEAIYNPSDMQRYIDALSYASSIICASSITAQSVHSKAAYDIPCAIIPYGSKLRKNSVPELTPQLSSNLPPSSENLARKIRLLTVCQVSQRKGLHWAFHAMKTVSSPGHFEWTIVTGNADPAILKMAPENARVLSTISNDELAQLMRDADLFVMPSLIEGFGLVYVEALSMGTPVLYTRNTGPHDFAKHGLHGFEVDIGSPDQIRHVFERIISGDIVLERMRRDCLQIASMVTWEKFRSGIRCAVLSPPTAADRNSDGEPLREIEQNHASG